MKILQIVADGRLGGGTSVVLDMCTNLMQREKVEVFGITQSNSYLLKELQKLNIPSYGLDFFKSRFNLLLCREIAKIIDEFHPEIIHVHGGRAVFYVGLLKKFSRLSIPAIYTAHGYHFRFKSLLTKAFFLFFERLASRSFECVVHGCRSDQNLALQYGLIAPDSYQDVIYNLVQVNQQGAREVLTNKDVFFLGRLAYEKDPYLFLNLAKLMRDSEFQFHMIGDGELREDIEKFISRNQLDNKVTLYGALSRTQALEKVVHASCLVVCSFWEVLPIVIREAFLLKVPVVAIDVDGISEAIEHLKTGYLINERSPQVFREAIISLHQNKKSTQEIVEHAYKFAITHFSAEACMTKYMDWYERLSKKNSPPYPSRAKA